MTEAGVLDFTSASYLGLRHPRRTLRPWPQLTTGVPAALAEPGSARALAGRLAGLAGTERAVLATSTLHAFWDLFVTLGARRLACYVDAAAYPIAGWGVERAAGRGMLVRHYPHRDVGALMRLLGAQAGRLDRLPVGTPWGLPGRSSPRRRPAAGRSRSRPTGSAMATWPGSFASSAGMPRNTRRTALVAAARCA